MGYDIEKLLFNSHIPPKVSADVVSAYRVDQGTGSAISRDFEPACRDLTCTERALPRLFDPKASACTKSHKQNKSIAKRMQWVKDGTTRLPLLEKQEAKKDNLPARKRVINDHNVGRRAPRAVAVKGSPTFDALLARFQTLELSGTARDHGSSHLAKGDRRAEESQPLQPKGSSHSLASYVTSAEREDLIKLSQWLDSSIEDARGKRDELSLILNHMGLAFFEIASQVYANCQERGMLLERLWRELTRLFQTLVDSTNREVTNTKAEMEVEKCKNRKLEDQVKVFSSLSSLWKQRAFDATTLISEDDTVRKIKVEWLQSVPSEPLDKERVGTDSRTSDQSEMKQNQTDEQLNELREKVEELQKEVDESRQQLKLYQHLADEEEALRIQNERDFETDITTIRLQNKNLASELEKMRDIVFESEDAGHLKEFLHNKAQRAEASTQTTLSEVRKSLKREKSMTIARGGSRAARRLTRESSLAADDSNIVQEDESVSEHGTDLEKIEDNDTETKEPERRIRDPSQYATEDGSKIVSNDASYDQDDFIPFEFTQFIPNVPDDFGMDMTLKECNELLTSICEEKIKVNKEISINNRGLSPFPKFVYEWALKQYGLPRIAVRNLCSILWSIHKYVDHSARVKNFALFLGFSNSMNPASKDGEVFLRVYLYVLEKLMYASPSPLTTNKETGEIFFNLLYVELIVEDELLRNQFGKVHIIGVMRRWKSSPQPVADSGASDDEDHDKFIWANFDLMMRELIEMDQDENFASELDVLFWAGDANMNGVLEFEEFKNIVQIVDTHKADSEVLQMYSQIVLMGSSDSDRMSSFAFSEVLKQYKVRPTFTSIFKILLSNWEEIKDIILQRLSHNEQEEQIKFTKDQVILLNHSMAEWESKVYKKAVSEFRKKGFDPEADDGDTQNSFAKLHKEHMNIFAAKVVEDFKSVVRLCKQFKDVEKESP